MGFLKRLFGAAATAPAERPASTVPDIDARERLDLRGELPPDCEVLVQGPPVKVVGESFYRDAIEAAVGLRPEGHRTIVDAAIVLDPDNPVDTDAVAIWIGGRVCGHLSRADAVEWRPVVAWYAHHRITPVARGDVNGGWLQPDGTWADYGITLYVAAPRDLAARQRRIDSGAQAGDDTGRAYDRETCPYCEATFDTLPKAKKRCPACGQTVFVRSGPDGLRHILREADLTAHEATWAAYHEAQDR
jgi:ssDNA-binding Zn-finger/Zn-ribbon topoisomerase 1